MTIARFRVRHEQALAGLLVESLRLCAAAGMVRLGLVALDGTKIEANAAAAANRIHAHLETQVAELLAQAAEADRADEQHHGSRGELPQALAGRAERLVRLQQARPCWRPRPPLVSSATSSGWLSWPPPPRARGQQPRARIRPRRRDEAPNPKATVNTTDPESRFVHGNGRTLQGYNAQAAATTDQVVVAAELTQQANDLQQLAPMLGAIATTLVAAGISDRVQRPAADSGYWSIANVFCDPGRTGVADPTGPPWPPRQAP